MTSTPASSTIFVPDSRNLQWGNLFVQDEIQLREGLKATLGVKLESNDYTGFEVLPSARLAWKIAREPAPVGLAVARGSRSGALRPRRRVSRASRRSS